MGMTHLVFPLPVGPIIALRPGDIIPLLIQNRLVIIIVDHGFKLYNTTEMLHNVIIQKLKHAIYAGY